METKFTLEKACLILETRYHVPEDFKRRIRQILQPLFRHDLSADEMLVIEKALERTYLRHAEPEPDSASGVAEEILDERSDFAQAPGPGGGGASSRPSTASGDAAGTPAHAGSSQPRAVTTGVPSAGGGKGGVLLVRIDPKTKTAQLIRLSADEVKVLANKAAISDFLKESDDDDTVVH
jgi:hypothetical protein